MTKLRALLAAALPLVAAACSSGGDSGPPPNSIAGTLQVLPSDTTLLEAEPNDAADTAHVLGALDPGGSITVVGQITDDGSDDFDGFLINLAGRTQVSATVTAQNASADLDILVVDPVSLQFVERFQATAPNESGSFVAKGSVYVLVFSALGATDYSLELSATAAPASLAEVEPNDPAGMGMYLGEQLPGDALTLTGNIAASDQDRFLLACPEAVTLNLSLADGGQDFDLRVWDASTNLSVPTLLQTFSTVSNPETGSVNLPAMTLAVVEVYPFGATTGPWTLDISSPSPLLAAGAEPARLSPAPRADLVQQSLVLRRHVERLFTEPVHPAWPGDLVVAFTGDPADLPLHDASLAPRGGAVVAAVPAGPRKVRFELPAGLSDAEAARYTTALAASLGGCAGVRYAEPDFRLQASALPPAAVTQGPGGTTPNDPFYNLQWHYPQIQLPSAWSITTGDPNVIVAVLDTGTTPHPDLAPREIAGKDMISNPSIAGDGNGVDNDPFDVGDSTGVQPSSYHGSHVAGTIGAVSNDGSGVAGTTWLGKMMHVRVLGIGGGSNFDILNGILWAARLPNSSGSLPAEAADVINMSLGGGGYSQATQDACTDAHNAGAVVVAAAGNENSSSPSYPAAYTQVISVSAVDYQAKKAPYSNFHPSVDIAAPGGDVSADRNGDGYADGVLSTKPDDTASPINYDSYAFYQGTSMAAPHVAGVAALCLAVNPTATPAQVESFLTSTATDLGNPGRDNVYGNGLVNALAAVQAAAGGGGGSPTLALASQSVLLDQPNECLRVSVANVGGGTLTVNAPTVSTDSGGSWLSASRITIATPVTSDTASIEICASAGSLPDGLYTGQVDVTSNGGSTSIGVSLSIGGGGSITDYTVFVLAVDANSDPLETIAQVVVQTGGDRSYSFGNLPDGDYLVVAGTDEDDDGFICDAGEPLCGIYPSLESASVLTVNQGSQLSGISFPLDSISVGASAGGGSGLPTFQLLEAPNDGSSDSNRDHEER